VKKLYITKRAQGCSLLFGGLFIIPNKVSVFLVLLIFFFSCLCEVVAARKEHASEFIEEFSIKLGKHIFNYAVVFKKKS
jgi:hypothetical protein